MRASLLRFDEAGVVQWLEDALLVVDNDGRVAQVADYASGRAAFPDLVVDDQRGLVLAPGFIDSHVHYPQIDIIASPAAGLLPWLNRYTFPEETRFAAAEHAEEVAGFFLSELLRHGVTTAAVFCTAHVASVDAFFQAAQERGLCMIAGKVLQDRHSPDGLRDDTEGSLRDSEALIQRWHGRGRLRYALTPRFAPASSPRQLSGAGELARAHEDVWVHSHVAENHDEIRWAAELFPEARSYLDIYDRCGLLRRRSIYAHCLHLDAHDQARMVETGALAAVCPTSNLFLGSGLFDFAAARALGLRWALASDVGGGTSLSPFRTMLAAYETARLRGHSLPASEIWFHHTAGAAAALDLRAEAGDLWPGRWADFLLLDPRATPLLARRTQRCQSLEEWLGVMMVLGDDRAVRRVVVAGRTLPAPGPVLG